MDEATRLFQLECYLGDLHFAFAQDTAEHLRLIRTADEKYSLREAEAVFEPEQMLRHDPRAEQLARQAGMPEDLIAMVKEGLKASREGRFIPSSEVFARLAQRYGR